VATFTFDLMTGSSWTAGANGATIRLRLSHADRAEGLEYGDLREQALTLLTSVADAKCLRDPKDERAIIFAPSLLMPNKREDPRQHEPFLRVIDAAVERLGDLGEVDRLPFDAAWLRFYGSLDRAPFWRLQQQIAARHLADETLANLIQVQALNSLSSDAVEVLVAARATASQKRVAKFDQLRPPRFDQARTIAALSELTEADFLIDASIGWLLGPHSRGLRIAELTLFAAHSWHR
jgi:hypothetical protein